ncbi:MAG: hypothetical protein L0177_13155 [Chloroflexi bacterium]|nr:hypothetical protein [Chloroflexota bacterium]
MTAYSSTERIEQFFNHLSTLKDYAQRVIADGDVLDEEEEQDRAERMRQFMEIGGSFDLNEKEMVSIIYRELFAAD